MRNPLTAETETPKAKRKLNIRKTPKKVMSAKQIAAYTNPERIAKLIESTRRYREANGGKPPTRRGYPSGWAGPRRRKLLLSIREEATKEAKVIMTNLVTNGVVDKDNAGNQVLEAAIGVSLAGDTYTIKDKLAAMRMVLDFTMAKPEQKQKVTVETAEDFLRNLAKAPLDLAD